MLSLLFASSVGLFVYLMNINPKEEKQQKKLIFSGPTTKALTTRQTQWSSFLLDFFRASKKVIFYIGSALRLP